MKCCVLQHRTMKCCVLGDREAGVCELLYTYEENAYPSFIPSYCDNYDKNLMVEGQSIHFSLWDISSLRGYKKIRQLSYALTHVFVICFSLISPTSLEKVKNKWLPELKEFCPEAPYILVGTKSNLRDKFYQHPELQNQGYEPLPKEKGEEMKEIIKATYYIECSPQQLYNVRSFQNSYQSCISFRNN